MGKTSATPLFNAQPTTHSEATLPHVTGEVEAGTRTFPEHWQVSVRRHITCLLEDKEMRRNRIQRSMQDLCKKLAAMEDNASVHAA